MRLNFYRSYGGEIVIRRMVLDAVQLWQASGNQNQRRYSPKVSSDDVFCIGRIVHKQSEWI